MRNQKTPHNAKETVFEPHPIPAHPRPRREWSDAFDDAVRGLASGFLIGIPVVFTVDSWWLGDQNGPLDSLILLGFSYVLTFVAVHWIGFRRSRRRGWQYVIDAIEALALAVLALVAVFWCLGQIGNEQAPSIAVGRIAVTVAPVSLGVAIANHFLPRDVSGLDQDGGAAAPMPGLRLQSVWKRTLFELFASVTGAFFMCLTIVPLDDLGAIATEVPHRNLPLVILLSLLITYSVVFAAGFAGEAQRHTAPGLLQTPIAETVLAYLAALFVSLAVLWLFGRVDGESAALEIYTKTVLLAFPASMAAAAGRLVV